jgi:hypothetical protein
MKLVKRVLLGSAAGLVAVVGAQAADLPVKAKPVEYVKICTLYGEGFYYIPGSDTCVKFGGYVRADYGYNVTGARTPHYSGAAGAQDRTVNNYSTRHRGSFIVDARTQTAYGTLRTYTQMHLQNENGGESTNIARAFIQWGGFTFGHTVSFTDHEGSLGSLGILHAPQNDSNTDVSSNGVNQIAYTWQLGNGITLNVGADERRVKSITDLSNTAVAAGVNPASARAGNNHPSPWVSLRINQAWGKASIAVVANHNQATYYTDTALAGCAGGNTGTTLCGYPSDKWGFAVISGAEIKLDALSPGSRIGFYANYGVGATAYSGGVNLSSPGLYGSGNQIAFGVITDAVYVNGSGMEQTTAWTVGGGLEYFWTRNFSTMVYGSYTDVSYSDTVVNNRWFCGGGGAVNPAILVSRATTCDPGFQFWTVGAVQNWYPLSGLRLAVDVMYTGIDTAMDGATVTLTSTQGARPSGAYLAKNQGIVSAVFRAQRTW